MKYLELVNAVLVLIVFVFQIKLYFLSRSNKKRQENILQKQKDFYKPIEVYDNYLIIFPSVDGKQYPTIYYTTNKDDWALRKVYDFKMVGMDIEVVRFIIDDDSARRTIVQTFGDLGVPMKEVEKIVETAVL